MTLTGRTIAAAVLCVTAGANAATGQLNEFQLNTDKLACQGTQRYGIMMHGRSPGNGALTFKSQVTMTTYFEDGRFVLADKWEIMGSTYDFEMHCRPNATLSLERGFIEIQRHNKVSSSTMEVSDELATFQGDANVEMAYPHGTVSQAALFRIIPQLPRQSGSEFTFNGYTDAIEMRVQTPSDGDAFKVVCKGEVMVDIDGESVTCTQFTVHTDKDVDFFVDRNAQIRKVVADAGDTVMILLPETPRAASVDPIP